MDQTLDMRNIPSIGLAKLSFQLIPQLSAGTAVQCEHFLTIAKLTNVRLLKYRIRRYMLLPTFPCTQQNETCFEATFKYTEPETHFGIRNRGSHVQRIRF